MNTEEAKTKNRLKVARWREANPERAREHAARSARAAKERRQRDGLNAGRNVKARVKNKRGMTDSEWIEARAERRAAREALKMMPPEDRAEYLRIKNRDKVRRHREKARAMVAEVAGRSAADIEALRERAEAKIARLREKREAARLAKKKPG